MTAPRLQNLTRRVRLPDRLLGKVAPAEGNGGPPRPTSDTGSHRPVAVEPLAAELSRLRAAVCEVYDENGAPAKVSRPSAGRRPTPLADVLRSLSTERAR